MVFTSNFETAKLLDGELSISGVSGHASDGKDAIVVVLLHDEELLALNVSQPDDEERWSATFKNPKTPFAEKETVFVTGIIRQGPDAPPLMWQQDLEIVAATKSRADT